MKNIKEGNSIYYSIENYPFPYPIIPLEKMYPTNKCLLEGVEYDIPLDTDLMLAGYGDYWQLPVDFDKSPHFYYFEEHIDKIKEYIDNKKFSLGD